MDRRTFLVTAIAAGHNPGRLIAGENPAGYAGHPPRRSVESILEELGAVPRAEHPRPDLYRPLWHNLNGLWEFAFDPADAGRKGNWQNAHKLEGRIIVPFCPESQLSGVYDEGPHPLCWYARSFEFPENLQGRHIRLHFGAVDYRTDVWLNGTHLGQHEGGYDPFDFDVTGFLKPRENRLVLRVDDDMQEAKPKGKQSIDPQGCVYMRVTGIWQTVWLEAVGSTYVSEFAADADPERGRVELRARVNGPDRGLHLAVLIRQEGKEVARGRGEVVDSAAAVSVSVPHPAPWSPARPVLYDLELALLTPAGTGRTEFTATWDFGRSPLRKGCSA